MGLSSGQARLLSITARLTDNEYRSQTLSNARMRLANASNQARIDYQDALKSNRLVYNSFDTNGNPVSTTLTPNVLYQYQPMKNQYTLVNSVGQVLVTSSDAKNYEKSENLAEFLDKYDLTKSVTTKTWAQNPEYKTYLNNYNSSLRLIYNYQLF